MKTGLQDINAGIDSIRIEMNWAETAVRENFSQPTINVIGKTTVVASNTIGSIMPHADRSAINNTMQINRNINGSMVC